MAKQGKCNRCKTYFTWDKETPFKKLCCPICSPSKNISLKRTSVALKKYKHIHLDKPPLKEDFLRC